MPVIAAAVCVALLLALAFRQVMHVQTSDGVLAYNARDAPISDALYIDTSPIDAPPALRSDASTPKKKRFIILSIEGKPTTYEDYFDGEYCALSRVGTQVLYCEKTEESCHSSYSLYNNGRSWAPDQGSKDPCVRLEKKYCYKYQRFSEFEEDWGKAMDPDKPSSYRGICHSDEVACEKERAWPYGSTRVQGTFHVSTKCEVMGATK